MKLLNSTPVFILTICLLFLFRVVVFASQFGGIEHDSGWYLGEAKNLALRGVYASYTNTVVNDGVGAFPSIHGRFSVQDANGYVYFPAGVSVGPGYVIPESVIIKLFGSGFWQYRAWPLIGFTAMLALTLFIVYETGGMLGLILFAIWMWFLPQFTTQFAYEAFGEDIAFGFLLAGFFLLHISTVLKKKKFLALFIAGVFLALSYLTKTLFVISVVGVAAFIIPDFFRSVRSQKIAFLKRWGLCIAGFLLPILLFQVYEQGYIVSQFGNSGWHAVTEDNRISFAINGSGIDAMNLHGITHLDWNFVYKKFLVWVNLGISQAVVVWLAFLLLPIGIYTCVEKKYRTFLCSLYIAAFVPVVWYLLFASFGWARHIWQGLIIAMVLFCICIGSIFLRMHTLKNKLIFLAVGVFGLALILKPHMFNGNLFFSQQTIEDWRSIREVTGLNGFPSNDTFSLSDEKGLVTFFSSHITAKDRVYYVGWFLNAEVSPLVDKVFYPLERFVNLGQ
ncbi:MAG: hypothetical protein KGL95_14445, partial [Patescibacteria group bacterium]|nr:hypothetical protein [Patescibacteria group bacterium]